MSVIAPLVGGVVVGGFSYALYTRLHGCSGGHVFEDYKSEDRWKVIPLRGKDSVGVKRRYKTTCSRDDCDTEDTEWRTERSEAYTASLNVVTNETHYRCPMCDTIVPNSERTTEWKERRSGQTRFEECPECECSTDSFRWTRLDYDQYMEYLESGR